MDKRKIKLQNLKEIKRRLNFTIKTIMQKLKRECIYIRNQQVGGSSPPSSSKKVLPV